MYIDRISLKRNATSTVTIIPSQPFDTASTYYVQIDETAFVNAAGDFFAGFSDPSDWRFSTDDIIVAGPDHYIWDTSEEEGYQGDDGKWGEDASWTANGINLFSWPDSGSSAEFRGEGGPFTISVVDTQNVDSILFSGGEYVLDGGVLNITGENASITTEADAQITSALSSSVPLQKKGGAQLTISGANEHELNQFHLSGGKTVIQSGAFTLLDSDTNQVSMSIGSDVDLTDATINAPGGNLVFGSAASAVVNLTGGVISSGGDVLLGSGANSTVTLSGGSIDAGQALVLGGANGSTIGFSDEHIVTAASGVINGGAHAITISGANHTYAGTFLHQGGGTASLTLQNNGQLKAAEVYSMGDSENENFTIALRGEETTLTKLETGRIYMKLGEDAAASDGPFNMRLILDGGILSANDDTHPIIDTVHGGGGTVGTIEAVVSAGGARINTGEFNQSIMVPLITDAELDGADGGLTKKGEGTLTLYAKNTYTGPTRVDEGTLRLGVDHAVPHGSGFGNLSVSGTFDLNGYSDTIDGLGGDGIVTSSGQDPSVLVVSGSEDDSSVFGGVIEDGSGTVSLVKGGSGSLTLSGDNTFSGGVSIAGGTLQIGAGLTSGAVPGDIQNDAILIFNRSDSVTFDNVISGEGQVHQNGAGILILNGANDYSGGTFVNSGSLEATSSGALGTSTVTLGAGASRLILGEGVKLANALVIDSGAGPESGGLIQSSGNDTLAGDIDISGKISSALISGDGSLIVNGALTAPQNSTISISHDNIRLGGGGEYGGLNLLGATTSLGADSGISPTAVLSLADSTTLDLNGFNQIINGLLAGEESGAVVTNSGETGGALHLRVNDTSYAYNGLIGGNVSVTKSGSGKQILKGNQTYTGATSVEGGVLRLEGSLESSDVAVAKGAVLDLSDSVGSAVSVSDSGALTSDSDVSKKVTVGSLSLQDNSIINISIDSTSDTIAVQGDLALDGVINLKTGGGAAEGTYTIMTCDGEITVDEQDTLRMGDAPAELIYKISIKDNEVRLQIIVPVQTDITNPVKLSGERINDGEVRLNVSGIGSIPTIENSLSPWADSIGVWFSSGSFRTRPDPDAEQLVKFSLVDIPDTSNSFSTVVTIPSSENFESSMFYFVGSVFWHNPDSIPAFISENGCSVEVITNPLEITGEYTSGNDWVALTVGNIEKLSSKADSIGLWKGFDEKPNFSDTNKTEWFSIEEFSVFGNTFKDTVADTNFSTISAMFYYAVVVKNDEGELSDPRTGSVNIGMVLPENELVLTGDTIGPQTVILDWGSAAFNNDSVRIWYGTDSIETTHTPTQGAGYKVLNPKRSQHTDTIHVLEPSTTYYFGLQRYENGFWSYITEQSRIKLTTPNAGLSNIKNTIVMSPPFYNSKTHEISVKWEIDTTGFGEHDTLKVGIEYSFAGYPQAPGPKTRVETVTSLKDSIKLKFDEGIVFDTLCYISMYLKEVNGVFASATDKSRDTVRTSDYTEQQITYFEDGVNVTSVFNDKVIFKRRPQDTNFGKNEGTVQYYEIDGKLLNGFIPVGLGFRLESSAGTAPFTVGIRYDSIPSGLTEENLCLYRVVDDKLLAEHSSYDSGGVVWVETDKARGQNFVLLADTQKPLVIPSDTNLVIRGGSVLSQKFDVKDNIWNVIYTVESSSGEELYGWVKKDTLDDTTKTEIVRIPIEEKIRNYGMRARIIVNDGVYADTINISRRVESEGIDEMSANPSWEPLAVRGTLENNSISSVLDELEDETTKKWKYDIYKFRLFRYMGTDMASANKDGWLEYHDSLQQYFKVLPGRLFWIKTKKRGLPIQLGKGITTSLKDTFEIQLAPGKWTDFASPFQFDVPFSEVMKATEMIDSLQIYHWQGANDEPYTAQEFYFVQDQDLALSASAKVLSGQRGSFGYTAYNPLAQPVTLRIPPVPNVNQGAAKRRMVKTQNSSQWGVWFDWRDSENVSTRKIRCIVDKNLGKTQRVFALPPSLSNMGAGVVDTVNKTLGGHMLSGRGDEQGYSWQIVLYNQGSQVKKVDYNLGNLSSIPADMEVRIWDPQKQTFEKPSASWKQETLQPSTEKTKWVVVGTDAYLQEFRKLVPGAKLAFAGCYPNPFSGRLSIRYTVPHNELKNVNFSIYDLRGRLIWHKSIEQPAQGNRVQLWDGRSNDNRKIASGQYILRMTATTNSGVKKIIGEQRIAYLPR